MSKDSNISDWPALQAWLEKYNAQFCYSLLPTVARDIRPSIEAWKVNGRMLHVVLYPANKGWDLVTSCDDNSTDRTLADAERRLGLSKPSTDATDCNPIMPGGALEAFVQRGMAAQSAIDAIVHHDGPEQFDTPPPGDDLVAAVRAYLSFVEINRADETDLDERVKAREEMTRYENQLKQLVGWEPTRVRQVTTTTHAKTIQKPSLRSAKKGKAKR